MKTQKPNIILVVMDSVRADALSSYGYRHQTTPNIDALLQDGVICKNAISNSGWTLPAMASLFTGRLVSHHGACDHHHYLREEHPTLAEVLTKNGYETIGFSENSFVSKSTGMDRGFKTFHELSLKELSLFGKFLKLLKFLRNRWDKMRGIPRKYCHTVIQMHEVRRWIKKVGRKKQPFFLYMHSNQPHFPFIPPRRFRKKFIRTDLKECLKSNQDREKFVTGETPMEDKDFVIIKALYDAELSYFDYQLGKIFSFLKSQKLYDNTMIIVTADHGEVFGEHNLIGHGLCLYDSLLKIPLVIRYPKFFKGQEITQQVQLSDIFPTIMDLLEIRDENIEKNLHGISINRLSEDPSFKEQRAIISEQGFPGMDIFKRKAKNLAPEFFHRYQCSLHAIRTNEHKFIWSSSGDHELYNLKEDPAETRNLIDILPDKAKELEGRLFKMADRFEKDHSMVSLTETSDKEIAKRLKDLGYL